MSTIGQLGDRNYEQIALAFVSKAGNTTVAHSRIPASTHLTTTFTSKTWRFFIFTSIKTRYICFEGFRRDALRKTYKRSTTRTRMSYDLLNERSKLTENSKQQDLVFAQGRDLTGSSSFRTQQALTKLHRVQDHQDFVTIGFFVYIARLNTDLIGPSI